MSGNIVPAAILVTIGVALFAWNGYALVERGAFEQAATSPVDLWDYSFSTMPENARGTHPVGDYSGDSWEFTISDMNVTTARLHITCTDSASGTAAAFQMTVTVTPANGTEKSERRACGNFDITLDVASVPEPGRIPAKDAGQAQENVPVSGNASKAVGTWEVTVSGNRGGVGLPAPGPSGSMAFFTTTWQASVVPVPEQG